MWCVSGWDHPASAEKWQEVKRQGLRYIGDSMVGKKSKWKKQKESTSKPSEVARITWIPSWACTHGCREPPTKSLNNVWHSTSFRGISPSWYHGMVRETYSYPWHECITHIFLLFFKNQSIPIKECFSKHHVAGVITATLSPVSYLAPPSVTGQFSFHAQKKL